jgi:hypothetical protein
MTRIAQIAIPAVLACIGVIAPAYAGAGFCGIRVPEPASLGLFAVGAGVVALVKFRRRK